MSQQSDPREVPPTVRRRQHTARAAMLAFVGLAAAAATAGLLVRHYEVPVESGGPAVVRPTGTSAPRPTPSSQPTRKPRPTPTARATSATPRPSSVPSSVFTPPSPSATAPAPRPSQQPSTPKPSKTPRPTPPATGPTAPYDPDDH